MAVIGWLMFGEGVRDEIIVNVLQTSGYPRALSICMILLTAIIPITKVPLKYVDVFVAKNLSDY